MTYKAQILGGVALSILTGALVSGVAFAQGAADGRGIASLEEITVTAERRASDLQTVPVAVAAFTEVEMERRQITETLDIARFVPNMIGHNNTGMGSANSYFIRGLGNTESIATFDPPVGTYVDDVYISRQNSNNFAFFDVERIEVLRGPQGTLFGRNTTGGAINVILKKPGDEIAGYAEVGYGRFNKVRLRGSVDLPVNDKVLTKLSAYMVRSDGWVDDVTTGEKLNGEETYGVRGAVRLLLSDNVTWDFAADYVDSDNMAILNFIDPATGKRISKTGLHQKTTVFQGLLSGDKQNFGLGNNTKNFSLYSNFDVETDFGTITAITGYRQLHQTYAIDFLNGPLPRGAYTIVNDGKHDQFSQEIKITGETAGNKLHYVAGFYYLNEDNRTDFADILFNNLIIDRLLKNRTEALAGYAQFDYLLTPSLTATAGIRFTHEVKELDFSTNPNSPAKVDNTALHALGIPTRLTADVWTPRFALQYQVTDEAMVFASATRGFRSGGWNARGTSAATLQNFAPEKVWSYEAGARTEWLDKRLRLNLTGFYSDTKDLQLPSAFTAANGQVVFITQNFADLEVYGLELELAAVPTAGLNIFGSLGWMHAEYKNLNPSVVAQQQQCLATGTNCGTGIINHLGEVAEPVRAPKISLAIGFNYSIPLTSSVNLVPGATLQHMSHQNVGTAGTPIGLVPARTLVDAQIGLEDPDGRWGLTLECKNCFSEYSTHTVLADQPYLNNPSTWFLRARYNFN